MTKTRTMLIALLLAICCFTSAFAEALPSEPPAFVAPTVVETVIQMGENSVRYPQLEGMVDETVQGLVNNAIVEKTNVAQWLTTLATLQAGGLGLTVSYQSAVLGDVLSVVVSAKGMMPNGREGQQYIALCFDLLTGEALTIDDLLNDKSAAVAGMEDTLNATYADELSGYLENSELSPLPTDNFSLDEDGVTFYYPQTQFSLLSGYCGAAEFHYDELTDYLKSDASSLPARIGALPQTYTDAEIKALIEQTVAEGTLPHANVTMGEPMTDVIARYRLLRTPDQFPGGRYFQLEAPAFRQVQVLSDAVAAGWQSSEVEGVHMLRTNLFGIQTGVTEQARWHEILGEPESSVAFNDELAYNYGLPVGTADYYAIGGKRLRLYADENGILYSVQLSK